MRRTLGIVFFISLLMVGRQAFAEVWPQGLSFVGLKDGIWRLYVVAKGKGDPQVVPTDSEPRTPAFHLEKRKVTYIADDGSLREQGIDGDQSSVLLKRDNKHAYTQPTYGPAGDYLYVIELKDGASVDTDILMLDQTRKNVKPVVTQRSAQFEPLATSNNELFYSNVLCTIGCGKIIQEIWRMDVVSGEANQLTMVNSIARQPSLSPDGNWLYFSSNKNGQYHIWRMNLDHHEYEELTQGNVTDISPALDKTGNLYFIRRSPHDVQLMRKDSNNDPIELTLPEGVTDIRDLEISW